MNNKNKERGQSPEQFQVVGLNRRDLFAAVAMVGVAHIVATTRPNAGGTLRPDWTRRMAKNAAELAYYLDEALDEIEKNGVSAKDSKQ